MNKQEITEIKGEKLSTGFKALDDVLNGGFSNDLIILAARPAMGKTSLALNIAQNILFRQRKPISIFSLELSKEQLMQRMLCTDAELDTQRLKTGNMQPRDWEKLTEAMTKFAEAPIYIDDTAGCTINYLRTQCTQLANIENDLGLIIIDYIQLMEGAENEDRGQQVTNILKELKALSHELNIPIISLSQLSRASESRTDKRPILSDFRESCSFVQEADIIMFLYRDDYYTPSEDNAYSEAEIIIAKNGNNFATSTAKLNFKNTEKIKCKLKED